MEENNNMVFLSKTQSKIFVGLAMQREEIQKMFASVIEAENEYIAMLANQLGRGDEHFVVKQNDKNELYLQAVVPTPTDMTLPQK